VDFMQACRKLTIQILGTNLTNATSVTFDGTPAAFTIVSSSQITATVPAGRENRKAPSGHAQRHAYKQRVFRVT
jgi:uncharacterized protein (TIGR03437 family)